MSKRAWMAVVVVALTVGVAAKMGAAAQDQAGKRHAQATIVIPDEDRFSPFVTTVFAGDRVNFVNQDTDNHTVVSDDAVNDGGPRGIDVVINGTDSNGGKPGVYSTVFGHPGTWVFYCRFHSHLGDDHQPIAPGPDGGNQDANGNFGTPMMGIVHVLARNGG